MDFMECHLHQQRKLLQTISADHGERVIQAQAGNYTTRNLVDMSQSTIIAGDPLGMMLAIPHYCSALHSRMGLQSHQLPSKHTVRVVKMVHMAAAELRPMLAEEAEISDGE